MKNFSDFFSQSVPDLLSGDIKSDLKTDLIEKRNERFLNAAMSTPDLLVNAPIVNKLIILIDIVGFSKNDTREQVYKIYLFQRYLMSQVLTNRFTFSNKIHISQFIPTGDGCYIVADETKPETAVDFLFALIAGSQYIKTKDDISFSMRVSALTGECVPFMDMAKHINYIGKGMNEASRILSEGQKALESDFIKNNPSATVEDGKLYSRNSLFLGDSLKIDLTEYQEDYSSAYYYKDISDKHGLKRNILAIQGIK